MTVLDSPLPRFHLAMPVDDLAAARASTAKCSASSRVAAPTPGSTGTSTATRSSPTWRPAGRAGPQPGRRPRRTGPALRPDPDHPGLPQLADRLRAAGVEFVIEPHVRFAGQTGEQWTMFLLDPAGNALEFKAFADDSQVFAASPCASSSPAGTARLLSFWNGCCPVAAIRWPGSSATGAHRRTSENAGAEAVVLDLEESSSTRSPAHLHDADAVVFAAGAGPGSGAARKETVDRDAAILLADAARS